MARKSSLENGDGVVEMSPLNHEDGGISIEVPTKDVVERAAWDNKLQFLMSVISYGVGLGNVWRFPYLCQQNGGGAFLIPYFIMLVLEGIPIFLLELGIGQRLRLGSIGVWNKIHPWIGGIGIGSTVIAFLVGLYYNMIIAWCIYYLINSFQSPLPWASCPKTDNGTEVAECYKSSSTGYYWYRNAIDITPSINDSGGMKWWMVLSLLAAWIIVYLCMMRGIQSSGKVVYFTATFPYIVLIIFFGRAITLKGSDSGLIHMFTPKMEKLLEPTVWLDAATQVFYSLGLGFGSLISFSSYNPPKNDCKRDAVVVSIVNCLTSVLSCLVVFAVLGFKGTANFDKCIDRNIASLLNCPPFDSMYTVDNLTHEVYNGLMVTMPNETITCNPIRCDLQKELDQAAEGTGLAFIVFTQAIVEFPGSPFWSVIFFLMLLTLGLGSMFGTLEGVVGNIFEMNLVSRVRKEIVSGVICVISFLVGLVFCTGAGEYWVGIFDSCSGSMSLLLIAFFELIGIIYVYGHRKFIDDIEDMVGDRPNMYWQIMWRFVSPSVMVVVFIASLVQKIRKPPTYFAWDAEEGETKEMPYPPWVGAICGLMVASSVFPIVLVFITRCLGFQKLEPDIPVSIKRIGTTISTTGMMDNMDDDNMDDEFRDIDTDAPNGDAMETGLGNSILQIPPIRRH